MAEYISKKKALDVFIGGCGDDDFTNGYNFAANEYKEKIKAMKSANVQPVKKGKWLHLNSDSFIFCSECEHEAYWDTDYGQQLFDYCPYCGTRMIKDGDT